MESSLLKNDIFYIDLNLISSTFWLKVTESKDWKFRVRSSEILRLFSGSERFGWKGNMSLERELLVINSLGDS